MDRQSGFDVCGSCRVGNHDAGLERWGLSLDVERSKRTSGSGEQSKTIYVLEATVRFPTPLSARAHFRQETGFDRLWQMVARSEPQGGDPLFDRAVFIEQAYGSDLPTVLADEGVQGAILELVATGGVRLGQGWVRVRRTEADGPPPLEDVATDLILLAVHLETLAQMKA
jgi:hypothetical protein